MSGPVDRCASFGFPFDQNVSFALLFCAAHQSRDADALTAERRIDTAQRGWDAWYAKALAIERRTMQRVEAEFERANRAGASWEAVVAVMCVCVPGCLHVR